MTATFTKAKAKSTLHGFLKGARCRISGSVRAVENVSPAVQMDSTCTVLRSGYTIPQRGLGRLPGSIPSPAPTTNWLDAGTGRTSYRRENLQPVLPFAGASRILLRRL